MWKSKRSVPMTNSERKAMVKRLYGVEDNHILTKVLELFGFTFDAPLLWDKIAIIALMHIVTAYTIYNTGLNFTKFKVASIIWGFFLGIGSGFGYTGGAHRLWSHKAYKAKKPLKVLLMFFWTITGQQTLYEWARDHRIHHKFNETDSDPFDVHRGMFFAHFGFNMMHRHPNALDKEKKLDFSDITDEPIVKFEIKYHNYLKCFMAFIIPLVVPVYCWNEQWSKALTVVMVRFMLQQHIIWSGNSVAHGIGTKPYDKRTLAVENKIFAIISLGEGWHNYHHAFAWDYKTSELGFYKHNLSTMLIDFFAKIGWAYDLRTASTEMIEKTVAKLGDGTHERAKEIASKYASHAT